MPLVQENKLRKELTDQGFRIEEQPNGFVVYGDESMPEKGIVRIHSSSLKDERSAAIAVMRKLEAVGFKAGHQSSKAIESREKSHAGLKVKTQCGIDGCTKISTPGPLSKHRKAKHREWWMEHHPEDRPHTDEEVQRVTRSRSGPVRVRHIEPKSETEKVKRLVTILVEATGMISGATEQLVEIITKLESERDDQRKRLARLEKIFGEAVDAM